MGDVSNIVNIQSDIAAQLSLKHMNMTGMIFFKMSADAF